jgi:hypothetical protein
MQLFDWLVGIDFWRNSAFAPAMVPQPVMATIRFSSDSFPGFQIAHGRDALPISAASARKIVRKFHPVRRARNWVVVAQVLLESLPER